jgi:hypothetical protein
MGNCSGKKATPKSDQAKSKDKVDSSRPKVIKELPGVKVYEEVNLFTAKPGSNTEAVPTSLGNLTWTPAAGAQASGLPRSNEEKSAESAEASPFREASDHRLDHLPQRAADYAASGVDPTLRPTEEDSTLNSVADANGGALREYERLVPAFDNRFDKLEEQPPTYTGATWYNLHLLDFYCADIQDPGGDDEVQLTVWGRGMSGVTYKIDIDTGDTVHLNQVFLCEQQALLRVIESDGFSSDREVWPMYALKTPDEGGSFQGSMGFTRKGFTNYRLSYRFEAYPNQPTSSFIASPSRYSLILKAVTCDQSEEEWGDEFDLFIARPFENKSQLLAVSTTPGDGPDDGNRIDTGEIHHIETQRVCVGPISVEGVEKDYSGSTLQVVGLPIRRGFDPDDYFDTRFIPTGHYGHNQSLVFSGHKAQYSLIYSKMPLPFEEGDQLPLFVIPKFFSNPTAEQQSVTIWVGHFLESWSIPGVLRVRIYGGETLICDHRLEKKDWVEVQPNSDAPAAMVTYQNLIVPTNTLLSSVEYRVQVGIFYSNHSPFLAPEATFRVLPSELPSQPPGNGKMPAELLSKDTCLEVFLTSCFYHKFDAGRVAAAFKNLTQSAAPHVVFHTGDQVYLDDDAVRKHVGKSGYRVYSDAVLSRMFIDSYLKSWTLMREVYRRGVQYHTPDDHDLYNGYPIAPGFITAAGGRTRELTLYMRRWANIAKQFLTSIQTEGKITRQFNIGQDLSFFVADTRSERMDGVQEQLMPEVDFNRLIAWITSLRVPGVLVLSQPLLVPLKIAKPTSKFGHDYLEEPNSAAFSQYDELVNTLAAVNQDIVLLAGDPHFSRFAQVPIGKDGKHMLYEVISSPLSLLEDTLDVGDERGMASDSGGFIAASFWDLGNPDNDPKTFPPDHVTTTLPRQDIKYLAASRQTDESNITVAWHNTVTNPETGRTTLELMPFEKRRSEENFSRIRFFRVPESGSVSAPVFGVPESGPDLGAVPVEFSAHHDSAFDPRMQPVKPHVPDSYKPGIYMFVETLMPRLVDPVTNRAPMLDWNKLVRLNSGAGAQEVSAKKSYRNQAGGASSSENGGSANPAYSAQRSDARRYVATVVRPPPEVGYGSLQRRLDALDNPGAEPSMRRQYTGSLERDEEEKVGSDMDPRLLAAVGRGHVGVRQASAPAFSPPQ